MENKVIWFDRKFDFIQPPEMFPIVIERLRGTPARLEEKVANVPKEALTKSEANKWSILQNIGHLLITMELWERRIIDFKNRETELHPADLNNTKTKQTDFNKRPLEEMVKEFRSRQENLVRAFENFAPEDASLTAHHPRLNKPMRLIDLAYFIAEHDDHHLSIITDLIRKYS